MQGLGLLVILFFFGLAGGIVGKLKGSSFFIWFLVSFSIPFIGLLAAVLYRYDTQELRRQCPECGKVRQAPRRGLRALRHRARIPRCRARIAGADAAQDSLISAG